MEYDGQIKMEEILGLKIKKVDNDDILLFDFLENQQRKKYSSLDDLNRGDYPENEREFNSEDGKRRALAFNQIRERNYKEKLQNDKIIVNNTNFTLKLQKDQKERDRRLKMIEERLKEKEEMKKKEEVEQQ